MNSTATRPRVFLVHSLSALAAGAGTGIPASRARAAVVYVAPDGSDTDPGTESRPFRTVQKGIDAARGGDTVFARAGTYDLAGFSRSIDRRLSLVGEHERSTVLRNGGTLTFSTGFTVRNMRFVDWRGTVFKLSTGKGRTLDGVHIDSCIFDGPTHVVDNRHGSQGTTTNVNISNCDFLNMKGGGVAAIRIIDGLISNIRITGNTFKDLSSTAKGCMAVFIGSNATRDTTRDLTITGNYFENITGPTKVVGGAGQEVHAVLAYGANLDISYNTVKNMTPGTDHEAMYMKAENSTMADNVLIDCTSHQGAIAIKGRKSHHNTVEGNRVLSKQGGIGIYTAGGKHVAFRDNYVKMQGGEWGIGLYVYEINETPAVITGNYAEARRLAVYVRGTKGSRISGNTLIGYEGKTMHIGRSTGTRKSGNTEHKGSPKDPPVAAASADRVSGGAPLRVNFSSAGSHDPNGNIVSYRWDFHDGDSSSKPNPRHTYTARRTYAATLIVTDGDGFKDMAYVVVRVAAGKKGKPTGRIFWIAEGGSDSNPGTPAQPWKTIGKANAALQPGDAVCIRKGTYRETIKPRHSGTPGNYIRYSRYKDEEVVITGVVDGVDLRGKSYVIVDGFKILRPTKKWVNMTGTSPCTHNIIKNCTMDEVGNGWAGIWLGDSPKNPGQAHHNRIINNTLKGDRHPEDLIYLLPESNYNLIEGNRLYNGPHVSIELQGYGSRSESGVSYNVIRNNYVQNLWHTGINVYTNANHNLVHGNLVVDCGEKHSENVSGSKRDRTAARSVHGGIQSGASYCIYRRNVLINTGSSTIESWGDHCISEDNRIYHNTYNRNYRGIVLTVDEHEINRNVLKNNIFHGNREYEILCRTRGPGGSPRENYFVNNSISGSRIRFYPAGDKDLSWLQTEYPAYWHDNVAANPQFVDEAERDLRLQPSSPMLDAGAFLTKTTRSGSGKKIPVEDARYFMDGWGIIDGDLIQLEGQTKRARIAKVDYEKNVLTIDRKLRWSAGQGVTLPYEGSAPDIGAYERPRRKKPVILPDGTEVIMVGGVAVRRKRKNSGGDSAGSAMPRREKPEEPPQLTEMFRTAESRFVDGDSEGAAELFRKILAEHPGTPSARKAAEYLDIVE